MAGASGSGEEMQTGRTNRAEGRTKIWAQVPPGQPNFNGPAIFMVEVAGNADDPDDYESGDSFIPSNAFDGLVARGWSGGSNVGGTGVIGRGGRNQGSGVVGLGGGSPEPGNGGAGGIGVHALGGPQADYFADPKTPPGAGLVAQGGRQSEFGNTLRQPHAAGVIGLGGGIGRKIDHLPNHPLEETGGVGVYGQGAELSIRMVPPQDETGNMIPGSDVPSGPASPGTGVLGRGGASADPRAPDAAGIVGLSGVIPVLSPMTTGDTGVFGQGESGVVGHGSDGPGVHGRSGKDRGGVFESFVAPQVQIVPQHVPGIFPPAVKVTPNAISGEREGLRLPKEARGGDLLVLMDDERRCTLWFCVESTNGGPAKWAQALLGPEFDGTT